MNNPYWANICALAEKQRQKGVATYGQGLEDNPADIVARINHLQEELIDGLMYCEWIKDKITSNGVTVQRWIPVSERLPENDVDVLVLLHTGDSVVVERCGETWKVRWNGTNLDRNPTHWIPLPEPPKEATE